MTRRYAVKNLKTGETKEFTGGEEARKKALALEDKWYSQGVEYTSELVEVCPTCNKIKGVDKNE